MIYVSMIIHYIISQCLLVTNTCHKFIIHFQSKTNMYLLKHKKRHLNIIEMPLINTIDYSVISANPKNQVDLVVISHPTTFSFTIKVLV